VKDVLLQYDRTLLVADPRHCEPKKCVLGLHWGWARGWGLERRTGVGVATG